MQTATVSMILEEMNLTALREACKLHNISIEHRNCAPYVAELERIEWDEQKTSKLVEIYKRNKRKEDGVFGSVQIARSSDLSTLGDSEIVSSLKSAPPKKKNDDILAGFQDVVQIGDEIKGTFAGTISRLVIIANEALVERKTIFVPFSIFRKDGYVLIKTSRSKDSRLCREKIMEILELGKLYYAVPEGIRDEGVNADDFNGRARDLIASLEIEEINGVYLRIGGDTKIKSINYKGLGDILEESKIKNDILNGALIVGVKGLIRHGDPLIDFSLKWWWLPSIFLSSEEVSQEVIDEIILKISKSYMTNLVR